MTKVVVDLSSINYIYSKESASSLAYAVRTAMVIDNDIDDITVEVLSLARGNTDIISPSIPNSKLDLFLKGFPTVKVDRSYDTIEQYIDSVSNTEVDIVLLTNKTDRVKPSKVTNNVTTIFVADIISTWCCKTLSEFLNKKG